MIRKLSGALALSLVLGASACKYNKEGVYIAYLPLVDDLLCNDTISENITDSDPPDTTSPTNTQWVYTDEATQSDAVVFVQIFESKDKNVIFQIADSTYVGTSDGGVITVEWVNSNDSVETAANGDAGYNYIETDSTSITNTITLTKNKESKGYTGTWKSVVNQTIRAEESDEWDAAAGYYYVTAGQINSLIFGWLTGSGSNSYDMVDCDSDPCFVEVTSICDGSFNFELVETDLDPEAYEGVKNAGQPNGAF